MTTKTGIAAFALAALVTTIGIVRGEDAKSVVAYDTYDLVLQLKVPQVFDNSTSLGERKFVTQRISGTLTIGWLKDGSKEIFVDGLRNASFKVGGKNVTYVGAVD